MKKLRVRITCFKTPNLTRVQTLPVTETNGDFCLICGALLGKKDRCMTIREVGKNEPAPKIHRKKQASGARKATLERTHKEMYAKGGRL